MRKESLDDPFLFRNAVLVCSSDFSRTETCGERWEAVGGVCSSFLESKRDAIEKRTRKARKTRFLWSEGETKYHLRFLPGNLDADGGKNRQKKGQRKSLFQKEKEENSAPKRVDSASELGGGKRGRADSSTKNSTANLLQARLVE